MPFRGHRLLNCLQIDCYLFGAFSAAAERHWPSGINSQLKVVLKLPTCGFKLLAGRLVITAYQKQQPHRYAALNGR